MLLRCRSLPPSLPSFLCSAITSDDNSTYIVDISSLVGDGEGCNPDSTDILPDKSFTAPSGYVKTTCFDPQGTYLAFACRDGSVSIYSDWAPGSGSSSSSSPKLVKRIQNVRLSDDSAVTLQASSVGYPLAWHPTGSALVAGTNKGVRVFARETWKDCYSPLIIPSANTVSGRALYDSDNWTGTQALCWSPNGRYLVAVDGRRMMTVWDFATGGTQQNAATGELEACASKGFYKEVCCIAHGYLPLLPANDSASSPANGGGGAGGEGGGGYSQSQYASGTQGAAASSSSSNAASDNPQKLEGSSDRIVGLYWSKNGKWGVHVSSKGLVGSVDLFKRTAGGGEEDGDGGAVIEENSPTAELSKAIEWPLPYDDGTGDLHPQHPSSSSSSSSSSSNTSNGGAAAAAGEFDDDDDAFYANLDIETIQKDAEAEKAKAKAANAKANEESGKDKGKGKAKAGGDKAKSKAKKYVDGAAVEASGDDDEDDDDELDEAEEAKKATAELAAKEKAAAAGGKDKKKGGKGGKSDDDDDDDSAVIDIGAMKRKHGFVDADEDGEDGLGGLKRLDDAGGPSASNAMDEDEDDGPRAGKRGGGGGGGGVLDLAVASKFASRHTTDIYGLVPPQQPFQPNATMGTSSASGARKTRYLCWNAVGAIVKREEGLDSTISFDFTDSGKFRATNLSDNSYGFTMAALSEHGYILASPYRPPQSGAGAGAASSGVGYDSFGQAYELAPNDGQASRIYIKPLQGAFGNDANNGVSTLELPVSRPRMPEHRFPRVPGNAYDEDLDDDDDEDGEGGGGSRDNRPRDTSEAAESAVAVAIGDGWAACVTDHQYLRFFTTGGNQASMFAVPGAPVTVVGRGALCAVIYHRSAPSYHKQNMAADIYLFRSGVDTAGGTCLARKIASAIDLPLRPRRLLQWACMAPNGMLVIHDDDGIAYATCAALEWAWTNIADTKHAAAHPELLGKDAPPEENEGSSTKAYGSRETRDSFWPVDITFTDPVNAAASGYDVITEDKKKRINMPFKAVPMIQAVLCKGKAREPTVSNPRPLTNWIPLRIGIVDKSGARNVFDSTVRMDEFFLRHELYRLQRGWMIASGLGPESSDSLTMAVANKVASAINRGEPISDAASIIRKTVTDEVNDNARYSVALDAATAVQMIEVMKDEAHQLRGSQLAPRLHGEKAFGVAMKVSAEYKASGAAERFNQSLFVKRALREGAVEFPPSDAGQSANLTSGAAAIGAFIDVPGIIDRAAAVEAAVAAGAGAGAGGARGGFGLAGRRGAAAAPPRAPAISSTADALAHLGGSNAAGSAPVPPPAPPVLKPGARTGAGARGGNPFAANKTSGASSSAAAAAAEASSSVVSPGKKRPRAEGLEALASPQRPTAAGGAGAGGAMLNRQSSLAQEARDLKRQRKE